MNSLNKTEDIMKFKKMHNSKFLSFVVAIAPALDPYVLSESGVLSSIHIMDLFCIVGIGLICLYSVRLQKKNSVLLGLIFALTITTCMSFLFPDAGYRDFGSAIKNILVWAIYAFILFLIWSNFDYEYFVKISTVVCIIATCVLFFQFVAISLGFTGVWRGQISFLSLSEYDQFGSMINLSTGNVRYHSFFQEASYYAIYCIPVFAILLRDNRYMLAGFVFLGILLSTSMLGILAAIIVFLYEMTIGYEINVNTVFKGVMVSVILTLVLYLVVSALSSYIAAFELAIDYIKNRMFNFSTDLSGNRMSSAKYRIEGYLPYFTEYPAFMKVFGAGAGQYARFLNLKIEYSNTFVTILLNYGYFGETIWIIWCTIFFIRTDKRFHVFIIFFIIVCALDQIWFNWYFYYLLSWFVSNRKKSRKNIKIEI